MLAGFEKMRHDFMIDEVALETAAIHRKRSGEAILFLHGFGSTKEDYADIEQYSAFDHRSFLAYDAPGCGETVCSDISKISIPFLVDTALEMLERLSIEKFHLIGHSMGGLTALMLASAHPQRVLSFTNIEGNIAPEDCFLSRQIIEYSDANPTSFFDAFIQRALHNRSYASALYSASLAHKVREGAVKGIFSSMIDLSDNGDLMDKFLKLACPKMFMYGDQNSSLSYLDHIKANGVRLSKISHCGHFPMYSNPVAMWREIALFLEEMTAD